MQPILPKFITLQVNWPFPTFPPVPHSFEESPSRAAIDIQEDDEQQTLGAKPFAPRYPVYKFGEGAPSTAASTTATATATLTTTPITPAEMTATEPVKGSNGVSWCEHSEKWHK